MVKTKKELVIESSQQIKLALSVLLEKLHRVIPSDFSLGQIVIKNGEITVKE